MIEVQPQEHSFLDSVWEELRKAGLQQYATLTESTTVLKILKNGKWRINRPTPQLKCIADASKLQQFNLLRRRFRELAAIPGHKFALMYAQFSFSLKLILGTKFPIITAISKLGYSEPQELKHTKGQVMLLVFWSSSLWHCGTIMQELQHIAERDSERWSNSVRKVAINCSRAEEVAMDIVVQKKWTGFEHFYSRGGVEPDEDQMFEFSRFPEVLLLDKEGTIVRMTEAKSQISNTKWEEQIEQLVNDTPRRNEVAVEQPVLSYLEKESWDKLTKVMNNLEDDEEPKLNVNIAISRTRIVKNDRLEVMVAPLAIKCYSALADAAATEKLVNKITQNLQYKEFTVKSSVEAAQLQVKLSYERAVKSIKWHNLAAKPYISNRHIWSSQSAKGDWVKQTKIVVVASGADEKQRRRLLLIAKQLDSSSSVPIEIDVSESYVGSKFVGLSNIQDLSGRQQCITSSAAAIQLIAFAFQHDSLSPDHISHLLMNTQRAQLPTMLHIIVSARTRYAINALVGPTDTNVKLYLHKPELEEDLNLIGYNPNPRFTVVVNQEGTVLYCGNFKDYAGLTELLYGRSTQFRKKCIPAGPQLEISDVMREVGANIDMLDYKASFDLTYVEQRSDPSATDSLWLVPQLQFTVRDSDQSILRPLMKSFEEVNLIENIIPTVELPLGKVCASCHQSLKLPYYYYFISKAHRCIKCASIQDRTNIQKLLRYPVLENSILIFSQRDRTVDVKRLGYNIQPESEMVYAPHRFSCDGCRGSSRGQARHICMGCKRQPNERDYVDFCLNCVTAMLGQDEQAKSAILERTSQEKHKHEHPLLRVLYCVTGYYQF